MFSSSSCDSENSDGDHKKPATTLSRRRSYSVSRGCTTITREASQYGKCRSSDKAIADELNAIPVTNAATSDDNVNKQIVKSDKRPNSKRFSRSNNQACKKLESSDTETASSNASNTDSTDNDTDTESQVSLNYIKPLLDSDECVDINPNDSSEQCSCDHLDHQVKAYLNDTTNSEVIDTGQTEINDQRKIDENRANFLICSDFTELSHEQQLEYQQLQEHTPHELDDNTSGVQSNEQFGLHSQSTSNENKLSIDTMVIINETTYKSYAEPTFSLQSNEIESCDSNIEAHTIDRCTISEMGSIKVTSQLTNADEGAINIPEFVIITINMHDVSEEFNSNNTSVDKHPNEEDKNPYEQSKQSNKCDDYDAANNIMHEWCIFEADGVVVVPPDSSCECSEKPTATHTIALEHIPDEISNADTDDVSDEALTSVDVDKRQPNTKCQCNEPNQLINEKTNDDGSICTVNDQIEREFTAALLTETDADDVAATHTDEQLNRTTHTIDEPIQSMASVSIHTQVDNVSSGIEIQNELQKSILVRNESSNGTNEIPLQENPKYTSLVMITQDPESPSTFYSNADNLPSNTVNGEFNSRNKFLDKQLRRNDEYGESSLADYFTQSLEDSLDRMEAPSATSTTKTPSKIPKRLPVVTNHHTDEIGQHSRSGAMSTESQYFSDKDASIMAVQNCYSVDITEDGLADDDSWVDSADESEVELAEEVPMCTAIDVDRLSIDFTLHTIVEESCEESEVETNEDQSGIEHDAPASKLEQYYFFGLADGKTSNQNGDESISDTSSVQSESMDTTNIIGVGGNDIAPIADNVEIMSSQLEKYFMSTFLIPQNKVTPLAYEVDQNSEDTESDEASRTSPNHARLIHSEYKKSISQTTSLELITVNSDANMPKNAMSNKTNKSAETDTCDDTVIHLDFDATVAIKQNDEKQNKNTKCNNIDDSNVSVSENDRHSGAIAVPAKRSRDSGFVGSNDDLLKADDIHRVSSDLKIELEDIREESKDQTVEKQSKTLTEHTHKEDCTNVCSSDEETKLIVSELKQFVKALIASNKKQNIHSTNSPILKSAAKKPLPKNYADVKQSQLIYFEKGLSRLMKIVPGINDAQVHEIVEYLSSEETWPGSYDSTLDLDDVAGELNARYELRERIAVSCQKIVDKIDSSFRDKKGDTSDELNSNLNRYPHEDLLPSFKEFNASEKQHIDSNRFPAIFNTVLEHIGNRLIAPAKEISRRDRTISPSPKPSIRYHKKSQVVPVVDSEGKTTESGDDFSLPRSKSHDLLLSKSNQFHPSPMNSPFDTRWKGNGESECFSWKGSFESTLIPGYNDSMTKLSLFNQTNSPSSSAISQSKPVTDQLAKYQSRSCDSIGVGLPILSKDSISKQTKTMSTSTNLDASDSSDDECRSYAISSHFTLPRQQAISKASAKSFPRAITDALAPTNKRPDTSEVAQNCVKSARYRPPGFDRPQTTLNKANSTVGTTASHTKNELCQKTRRIQSFRKEDTRPMESEDAIATNHKLPQGSSSQYVATSSKWTTSHSDDIDRLVPHQTKLSQYSESMGSIYSAGGDGRYGTVTVKGQIELGLQYNYKQGALEIYIAQCKDLAAVDTKRNRSDPYVKVYLLPDKSKNGKRKTKVKKHILSPVFAETLKYFIPLSHLELRTLWVTVWHSDIFGRNDFLGEVNINLDGRLFDNPRPQWYPLQERNEPFDDVSTYRGDIIIGLKFVSSDARTSFARSSLGSSLKKIANMKSTHNSTSKGTLHVLVKEAKNLIPLKAGGVCDAFCKSYLLPDKNRNSKQKTNVAKHSNSPVWNYTFTYEDVSLNELTERALELTLWDHDRLASNSFLGVVRFSLDPDATGNELSLWQSMLDRPNFWVEGCICLRSSLETSISLSGL